ncbi:MAG: Tim44-like domain-containing protein [Burkholderiaceae bacterium]
MKSLILALSFAVAGAAMAPTLAEAKRFGGGGFSGMKRSIPARTPPAALPAKPAQATPNAPGTAGAAAAPKRSWMGPIAGLAAGLGLAALMSHLGMGAEFANFIMMALLAVAAFVAIRFVMARFARGSAAPRMATPNGMQFSGSASSPQPQAAGGSSSWSQTSPTAAFTPAPAASTFPAGFDAEAFERIAKLIFIRMQAANDSADLNDLRQFTTPEMFAAVKLDLQDRGSAAQTTDVVQIDAEVLDFTAEAERQIVSVRFHGLIREARDSGATPFDEIWQLVKPIDASREWAIAGVQQSELNG